MAYGAELPFRNINGGVMEKLLINKRIMQILFIASILLGLLGGCLALVFAMKLKYVPLAVGMLFFLHGCYGTPFYLMGYKELKNTERLCKLAQSGVKSTAELSEVLGFKEEYTVRLGKRASERFGLLSDIFTDRDA